MRVRSVPLAPRPDELDAEVGLWAGEVVEAVDRGRSRRGRQRAWSYGAAAGTDEDGAPWLVAAAVIAIGPLRTAFALGRVGDETLHWGGTVAPPGAAWVGSTPSGGARYWSAVRIDANGGLALDVDGWSVRTEVVPGTPAICATPTPAGGWNVTQKCAGDEARAVVRSPSGSRVTADGVAWRDWTLGRQDRHTEWTWSAGGALGPTRVGWNLSTGMNEAAGEDVLWLDGVPHRLDGAAFAPTSDPTGSWRLASSALDLELDPIDSITLDRRVGPITSRYVKPFGRWRGSVTTDDTTVDVDGLGVAEHHVASW